MCVEEQPGARSAGGQSRHKQLRHKNKRDMKAWTDDSVLLRYCGVRLVMWLARGVGVGLSHRPILLSLAGSRRRHRDRATELMAQGYAAQCTPSEAKESHSASAAHLSFDPLPGRVQPILPHYKKLPLHPALSTRTIATARGAAIQPGFAPAVHKPASCQDATTAARVGEGEAAGLYGFFILAGPVMLFPCSPPMPPSTPNMPTPCTSRHKAASALHNTSSRSEKKTTRRGKKRDGSMGGFLLPGAKSHYVPDLMILPVHQGMLLNAMVSS